MQKIQDRGLKFGELCRLCSSADGIRIVHIFDGEGKKRQLLTLIESCLPVSVSENDTLPKLICHRCLHKLEMFQEFRENCIKSEEKLKGYAISAEKSQAVSTLKIAVKEEADVEIISSDEETVEYKTTSAVAESNRDSLTVRAERHENEDLFPKKRVVSEGANSDDPVKYLMNLCKKKQGIEVVPLKKTDKDSCQRPRQEFNSTKIPEDSEVSADAAIKRLRGCSISITRRSSIDNDSGKRDTNNESVKAIKIIKCETCAAAFSTEGDYQDHRKVCVEKHKKLPTSNLSVDYDSSTKGSWVASSEILCDSGSVSSGNERDQVMYDVQSTQSTNYGFSGLDNNSTSAQMYQQSLLDSGIPKDLFECEICGEKFHYRHTYATHRRVHTGEKLHECETCHKLFAQRSILITHKRTHTGERPYKCSSCGKGFSQLGNLNVHRRSHCCDKAFSCRKCGKTFKQQISLISHNMLSHSSADGPSEPENVNSS